MPMVAVFRDFCSRLDKTEVLSCYSIIYICRTLAFIHFYSILSDQLTGSHKIHIKK